MKEKPAILVLEDGRFFVGKGFGADGERGGEAVFNTAMTGYQEILTDPSYSGQIVVMTYPEIGNYGVNSEDVESAKPWLEGFAVRNLSRIHSNWRSESSLNRYLADHGIVGICDIDTRALVRHLRNLGSQRCMISTRETDPALLLPRVLALPRMEGQNLAEKVSCPQAYAWPGGSTQARAAGFSVAAYDFGIKRNILHMLEQCGCRIQVVPAGTPAADILAMEVDGVFLSNGPGDPQPVEPAIAAIRQLLGKKPLFGICLGHQLLGLALGGNTYKLKFGHHGANHPVQNRKTGRVEITSQNHGFAVDPDSLPAADVEITHLNLNDGTVEGLQHRHLPAFSVQYHPESAPGPHDSHYLFQHFIDLMTEFRGDA